MSEFVMTVEHPDAHTIALRLFGEFAGPLVEDYSREFLQHFNGNAKRLVVELSKSHYLDSSAVRLLMEGAIVARKSGKEMIIRGVNPSMRRLFEIIKLNELCVIEPDPPGREK